MKIGTIKRLVEPIVATRASATDGYPSITITTRTRDRENDRMLTEKLQMPERVPVLWAHDPRELPVAMTVGYTRTANAICAAFRWLEGDDQATRVRNAHEQGFLAASVGVRVTEAEPNLFGGFDIGGEVVEWSLCSVPANPECIRALKSLGLIGEFAEKKIACPRGPNCPNSKNSLDCPAGHACPIVGHALASLTGRGKDDVVLDLEPELTDTEVRARLPRLIERHLAPEIERAVRDAMTQLTGRVD